MVKIVIKIIQGGAVTQTVLGGLTTYPVVANFLWCICAKNYENRLAYTQLLQNKQAYFFGPPCM